MNTFFIWDMTKIYTSNSTHWGRGSSVDDYINKFYHLMAKNDLFEMKEQLVTRYPSGL
jgi:hypothetical protein